MATRSSYFYPDKTAIGAPKIGTVNPPLTTMAHPAQIVIPDWRLENRSRIYNEDTGEHEGQLGWRGYFSYDFRHITPDEADLIETKLNESIIYIEPWPFSGPIVDDGNGTISSHVFKVFLSSEIGRIKDAIFNTVHLSFTLATEMLYDAPFGDPLTVS